MKKFIIKSCSKAMSGVDQVFCIQIQEKCWMMLANCEFFLCYVVEGGRDGEIIGWPDGKNTRNAAA